MVKTDGSYIYVLKSSRTVEIYRAEAGEITAAATVQPETGDAQISYQDMYVDGDRMILAGNIFQSQMSQEAADMYRMDSDTRTVADVYDISDPENPEFLGEPPGTASISLPEKQEIICIFSASMPRPWRPWQRQSRRKCFCPVPRRIS